VAEQERAEPPQPPTRFGRGDQLGRHPIQCAANIPQTRWCPDRRRSGHPETVCCRYCLRAGNRVGSMKLNYGSDVTSSLLVGGGIETSPTSSRRRPLHVMSVLPLS
jgi:hypothetical protein